MRAFIIAGLALACTTPAFAQSDNAGANDDSLTIGVGAANLPRFEGASSNRWIPAVQFRGQVSGIAFTTQGAGLYVDLIPRRDQTGGKLLFGPVIHVETNRTSIKHLRDPQVAALGKRDTAIELGAQLGYTQNGVITSDYDNLTISVAAYHDVAGAHGSTVVVPQISYGTPLSKSTYVGVSVAAHHVGKGFGRDYFGVTPAGALASGLPVYDPGSGFKDVTFGGLAALSLSGDLRRGFALFGAATYTQYLGDFKRSPITRDNSTWGFAVGVGYTF